MENGNEENPFQTERSEPARVCLAIDLKSFYASVECVSRGLDPLTTRLVVADESRTDKTICLAVSPALKAIGVPGRPRLFEVRQILREVGRVNPSTAVDFIVARPRMAEYLSVSARIYGVYLRHLAPEEIHVYSIDEVFIEATPCLRREKRTPRDLARTLIHEILQETGITATAGIGTNLYLAKVAMDVVAKHVAPDADGVRLAELTEAMFRRRLWTHRPLTDFWRVGRGLARRLESLGIFTMGDLARASLTREETLYRTFGVNAEFLIDHAWGWEPCTVSDIKAYRPELSSRSSGQVLLRPYAPDEAKLVAREMADALALDLVAARGVASGFSLAIGFDRESLATAGGQTPYRGPLVRDAYGRRLPKPVHGGMRFKTPTSSGRAFMAAADELFDRLCPPHVLVRRLTLTAGPLVDESDPSLTQPYQPSLFEADDVHEKASVAREREHKVQQALLAIKSRFGKNAVLKGTSLCAGSTARNRNEQIGGHHA